MSSDSTNSDSCDPPFDDWSVVLDENVSTQQQIAEQLGPQPFQTMRREIIAAARSFSSELNSTAADVGLTEPVMPRHLDGDLHELARKPIVASGHQPIIFHPGILAKNLRLEQLANQKEALGLLVLIDTDEGDASQVVFPSSSQDAELKRQTESLGDSGKLFLSQSIGDVETISNARQRVTKSLSDLGFTEPARRVDDVLGQYSKLKGKPTAIANSIVRRIWENQPSYLEVPLSAIVSLPSVRAFIESLIRQGANLHETYNATLTKYRKDHKIRNRANPFPNLSSDGASIELPFWIVDVAEGTRSPLVIDRDAPQSFEGDKHIVPRGMLITTILRLILSDVFIHGTGGAKYDKCTDQFVSAMFNIVPPKFVAATATRHLFTEELAEVAKVRALREQVKEVYSRFKRHAESGTFQGAEQANATDLLQRRTDAIERLKAAKAARESAAAINVDLKEIDNEIMLFVERVVTKGEVSKEPSPETLQVLENRTYPYFFFSKPNSSCGKQ